MMLAHEKPSLVSWVASLVAADWDNCEIDQATLGIMQTLFTMALRTAGDGVVTSYPVDAVIDLPNELRLD